MVQIKSEIEEEVVLSNPTLQRLNEILTEVHQIRFSARFPDISATTTVYVEYLQRLRADSARFEALQIEVATILRRAKHILKRFELKLAVQQASWVQKFAGNLSGQGLAAHERSVMCDLHCIDAKKEVISAQDLVESVLVVSNAIKEANFGLRSAREDLKLLLGLVKFQIGLGEGGPDSLR